MAILSPLFYTSETKPSLLPPYSAVTARQRQLLHFYSLPLQYLTSALPVQIPHKPPSPDHILAKTHTHTHGSDCPTEALSVPLCRGAAGGRSQTPSRSRGGSNKQCRVTPPPAVQGYRVAVKKASAAKVVIYKQLRGCEAAGADGACRRPTATTADATAAGSPQIQRFVHLTNQTGPPSELIRLVKSSRRKRRLLLDPALNQRWE